jgi:septal ring factor EnvC (AmiA/AmiB activator)
MNKRTWIGALALMLALLTVLATCGGKSVEQLTKESLELVEQMEGLDPSNPADAAKLAKLGAQAAKLAAELEKAEAKAAGKPAKAARRRPQATLPTTRAKTAKAWSSKSIPARVAKWSSPGKLKGCPWLSLDNIPLTARTTTVRVPT